MVIVFECGLFKKRKKGSFHGLDDLIGASDRLRGRKALDSMIRLKIFIAEDRSKIFMYRTNGFLEDLMRDYENRVRFSVSRNFQLSIGYCKMFK